MNFTKKLMKLKNLLLYETSYCSLRLSDLREGAGGYAKKSLRQNPRCLRRGDECRPRRGTADLTAHRTCSEDWKIV